MENLDDWDKETENKEVTTAQLDHAVAELQGAKLLYEEAKLKSDACYAQYDTRREQLVSLLTSINKKSYKVDGIGTVTVKDSIKVQTPKTPEEKAEFFKWLKEELGADGFLTYATVNHNSLNSLYNTKCEEYAEKGVVFTMPGIGAPVSEKILSFRKN